MPNWVINHVKIIGPDDVVAKALDFIQHKDSYNKGKIDFANIEPIPKRLLIVSGGSDKYYVALYLRILRENDREQLRAKLANHKLDFYGDYSRKYAQSFAIDIPEPNLNHMVETFRDSYSNISPTSMEDVGEAYINNILEYGDDTWYGWCCRHWGTKWNAVRSRIFDDGFEFETAWSAPFPIVKQLSEKFPELTFYHEWADEDLGNNCGKHEIQNGVVIDDYEFEDYEKAHDFACMMWGYDPDEEEDSE